MNMTTEHSTYTYEGGAQETVALTRGRATPPGHAVLRIEYSEGRVADCYVNTAWLRDRADDLAKQRPEGAEGIEALIRDLLGSHPGDWYGDLADHLASHLTDPTRKEA